MDRSCGASPALLNSLLHPLVELPSHATHMDHQIGRILDALEKSGKADQTYVFFTADHGLAVGHHGLPGKQNLYDHSVRVPFLISGPKIEAGRQCDTRIYLQDVMPTTLQLAGVSRPAHVQFRSLMPLIQGDEREPYPAIYGAYLDAQRMITEGDYKLILYPAIAKARLYNTISRATLRRRTISPHSRVTGR